MDNRVDLNGFKSLGEKNSLTGLYCSLVTVEMTVNVLLTLSDDHGGEEEEISDQLRTQLVN